MLEIIFYSILIMLASLIGVFSLWKKIGGFVEKNLHYFISFSAGIFLIIAYQLIVETYHHSENFNYTFLWVLVGMIGVWLISKLIPEFQEHDYENKKDAQDHHHKIDSKKIIVSDAIHNIGDGILLAAAFTVSSTLGVLTFVSVLIHELIQETSEFFVLRQAGYSTVKALKINFAVSATILIGSIGGFLLLDSFEILEVPLLGMAGGAFLIVVLYDLIPHSFKHSISKKHFLKHIMWFGLGLAIMFLISSNLEHEHGHEHEDENEHLEEEIM